MATFGSALAGFLEMLLLTGPSLLLFWRFGRMMDWLVDRVLGAESTSRGMAWIVPTVFCAWLCALSVLWVPFCWIFYVVWLVTGMQ